jgi:flagellar hook-associated protein 1 FlgK
MSLSGALNVANNALNVFSAGIQVTGQNLSNASTSGYLVQNLELQSGQTYGTSPLTVGTGVQATGITTQVNQFLQQELLSANSDSSSSSQLNSVYTSLQNSLQALGDNSLSTQFSAFSSALSNLANDPSNDALNSQAVDAGTSLADSITSLSSSLTSQREQDNTTVQQLVTQANSLIQNIAQLNPQISGLEADGLSQSQPGSQLNQMYQDLNQLSQIIPVSYTQNSNGSFSVYSGGSYLVLGTQTQQLQTVSSSSNGVATLNVQIGASGPTITASSGSTGELSAVLQGRDTVLGGFVQDLNTLTSNLISSFNQIYASGQGTDGYTSVTSANSVSDPSAALDQAGLAVTPQNGSFQLEVTNENTGLTTTSTINVNLTGSSGDTTLDSLASEINSVANVSASVTNEGNLEISADPNYEIQFSDDTSNVLSALGVNTFFTGTDASNIAVNQTVTDNPNTFASGQGSGASDGSNALALSQFATNSIAGLDGQSLTDNYNNLVAGVANNASTETTMSQSQDDYLQSLTSQQQQYSGVSLDQQAIQLMQYQEDYQASAKVVTTIDSLYQVLMNM